MGGGAGVGEAAVGVGMVAVVETAVVVEMVAVAETAAVVEMVGVAEIAVAAVAMEAAALLYTSNPPADRPSMFRRPPC